MARTALLATSVVVGCAQVLGIEEIEPRGGGGEQSCTLLGPGACLDDDPCTDDRCDPGTGQCTHSPRTGPALPDEQIPGDCQVIQCSDGTSTTEPHPEDKPTDGTVCTEDLCEGSTPVYAPVPAGAECDEEGGQVCDGFGRCKRVLGRPCESADQCLSGLCPLQDGVCCDRLCDGPCEACVADETYESVDGTCAPIRQNLDPAGECGEQRCDGEGACYDWCNAMVEAPGGPCPAVCTGGCSGGTFGAYCHIECGSTWCQAQTIACPPGFTCDVQCNANLVCADAIIECPEESFCFVECQGTEACASTTVNCPRIGTCLLRCGTGNTCPDAVVHCGENQCWALCDGYGLPTFDCGTACACNPCT